MSPKVIVMPQSGPPMEWDMVALRRELAEMGLDWEQLPAMDSRLRMLFVMANSDDANAIR